MSPVSDSALSEAERVATPGAGARKAAAIRARISMCLVVFLLGFTGLALRVTTIATDGGARVLAARPVSPKDLPRPEIIDRNGMLLAVNLPMQALEIAGREVWNARETAFALRSVFPDIDADALAQKLAEGRYVEVFAKLTPAQAEAVFALGLPGVRFSPRLQRYYPHGDLAAHVIGHTEAGRGGVMGLERTLDEFSADGPLIAALDIRAQQVLEQQLAVAVKAHDAIAGWGAVIDVATGEIVALANVPDFDPNAPGAAPADSRRNRAVYDLYELGSAFKIFTAAAALESRTATLQSTYDARGEYRIADKSIRDFRGKNRVLTFKEVVLYSSNIGAARMAAAMGTERQKAMIKALGMGEALPVEIAETRRPLLPRRWGPVETATIAYGHGISVTPLHLLAAFAATVNGGVFYEPTLVKRDAPPEGRRVFSEQTSKALRTILRSVITEGTASRAEAEGYYPIGKTATAEKAVGGKYNRNARIASFVGAFPGDRPRFAILVSLDDPQPQPGSHGFATAGWNAAPLFGALTAQLAPMLGVIPLSPAEAMAAFPEEAPAMASLAPVRGGTSHAGGLR